VQVLSMQLGVTPVVSTAGALPEYQGPTESVLGVDDVNALARAFDALADPDEAAARGEAARKHYRATYSAVVSAQAMVEVLRRGAGLPG
ncbi:glycosyltransferase, partial [Microtetraspora sp. AC03309]|uniref:glycosyltransferase family protein n=1 Tax=Microtetraspora sp. AC03309 TaxID=2779376 RepID=UPI001E493E25